MILNDLFLHTKSKLRDEQVNAYSDEEIIDCCRNAYAEVCRELGIFRKTLTLLPFEKRENEQFYPKPSDMVSIIALKHNGKILPIKSFDSVHSVQNFSDVCGYLLNDSIVVVNGRTDKPLFVAYAYTKSIMDLSETLELPELALDCLLNFTLYLLKRENRNDALQKGKCVSTILPNRTCQAQRLCVGRAQCKEYRKHLSGCLDKGDANMDTTKYELASQAVIKGVLRKHYMQELETALKNSAMNDQEKASIFAETLTRCYQIDCNIAFQLAYQSEILDVQAEVAKQSAPFEIAQVQNQSLKLKAEAVFTANQSELVSAQRKTEVLRRKDVQAGIELKFQQQVASYIAALKEEDTRRILLQSSLDNVFIKRAEFKLQYMKILSEDNGQNIEEKALHDRVKAYIDGIGKNSDYSYTPFTPIPAPVRVSVVDDGFDSAEPAIDVQIVPSRPVVNEVVRFIANTANADRDLEFEWIITEIAENEPIRCNDFTQHFRTDGYKNVSLLVKERNNAKVWTIQRRIYVAAE